MAGVASIAAVTAAMESAVMTLRMEESPSYLMSLIPVLQTRP
jgi:hypothetical protein